MSVRSRIEDADALAAAAANIDVTDFHPSSQNYDPALVRIDTLLRALVTSTQAIALALADATRSADVPSKPSGPTRHQLADE